MQCSRWWAICLPTSETSTRRTTSTGSPPELAVRRFSPVNTNVDQWFRQTYQEHFRPADSNLDFVKDFGTGGLVIPAMAGLWFFDQCIVWVTGDEDMPAVEWIDQWSNRSLRGWLVGGLPLVTLQYVTGASRPGQTGAGSHWTPFKSTHGVSGHAFVGSVPFFTAAEMTDFIPLKVGFYALGSAAGISRIYTDSHYLSQVALGWLLSYFLDAGSQRYRLRRTRLATCSAAIQRCHRRRDYVSILRFKALLFDSKKPGQSTTDPACSLRGNHQ